MPGRHRWMEEGKRASVQVQRGRKEREKTAEKREGSSSFLFGETVNRREASKEREREK